jgi:D-alanine-D-alanine ligase-like ATP-grasp enzyme
LTPAYFLPVPQNPGIYIKKDAVLAYSHLGCHFPGDARSFSEDGTLQGLFELADIAYVGAGVLRISGLYG